MPRIATIAPNPSLGLDTGEVKQAATRAGQRGAEAADMIQRGVAGLGKGIEALGEHVGQQQKADYLSAFTQHQLDEEQQFEKAKQTYGNDPDFTKKYLDERKERLDQFNEQFDGSMWGTGASEYQRQVNDSAMLSSGKDAVAFQVSVARDKEVAAAETGVNAIAQSWAKDPLNGATYLEQYDKQIAPLLPAEHAATETVKLKREMANTAGEGLVNTVVLNPNASAADADSAMKALTDPDNPLSQLMSGEKSQELQTKLMNFKYTMASTQTAIAEQQFPDIVKALKTSGSTDAYTQGLSLIEGHLPTSATPAARREAEIWKAGKLRELQDAAATGKITSGLMDKSDIDLINLKQEAEAARGAATTDEGRRTADATLAAVGQVHALRDADFNRDPAAYSSNHSPAVNAAAQAFAKQPNAQTWADYAAKQTAYQQQIKGQGFVPHLSTKTMDAEVSSAMQGITDQANGTQAAGQMLAKWAGVTGGNWPNLAREWMDRHIIDQDQYAAAQLVGKPNAAGLVDPLLSASRMNDKQRFDLHGLGEHQARAAAVKTLGPLAVSLANIPNAASTISAYTTALTHLMQVRGKVDSSEAQDLANRMVLDEYDFHDGGTLRVPKSIGDTASAGKGAERMKADLGPYLVDVPKSYSGLGAGDQRSNYLSRLESDAHWYATPDGKGATLYPSPGASTPVTIKGKALTLSWKQLQDMGR